MPSQGTGMSSAMPCGMVKNTRTACFDHDASNLRSAQYNGMPLASGFLLPVAGGGEGEGTGGDRLAGGGEGMVAAVPAAGGRGDGDSSRTFCVHLLHPYLSRCVMTGLPCFHWAGVQSSLGSHTPQHGQYCLLRP